jgi:hydrogenase maturation protease
MIPAPILVIGYGNTLRRDDGAGPRVAEAIGRLGLPDVQTLILHQLSPEHADPVIFVDAALGGPDTIQIRPVAPSDTHRLEGHTADPAILLALARDIFGHAPVAWLVTLPIRSMDFGEHLDPVTEARVPKAVTQVLGLLKIGD